LKKTKILMVCLGNICRSPLAEGILKSKLPEDNFYVDSAGTASYHVGDKPDSRSISIAQKNHIDISTCRGRQFKTTDFEYFDYIYAMDYANYKDILALARDEQDVVKVDLLLNVLFPGENIEVPDPYYGGTVNFEEVYQLLDKGCDALVEFLKHG